MKKHQSAIVVTILAIILLLLANQSKNDSAVDFDKRISELLLEVDTLNLELDEAYSSNERLQAEKKEVSKEKTDSYVAKLKEINNTVSYLRDNETYLEEVIVTTREKLHKSNQMLLQSNNKLAIYEVDFYTDNKYISYFIEKEITIEKNLEALASELSEVHFNGLSIDFIEIKNIDGKRTALIDLKEDKEFYNNENYSPSWHDFSQGTSGGGDTMAKLISAFLQRDLSGEWIDAVEFDYNGKSQIFEHMDYLFINTYLREE